MKKVEYGTFVYSKEFGHGIVTNPKCHISYVVVWFEDQVRTKMIARKEFFVRGDLIKTKGYQHHFWNKDSSYFYERCRHNPTNHNQYTITDMYDNIMYTADVQHEVEKPRIAKKDLDDLKDRIAEIEEAIVNIIEGY